MKKAISKYASNDYYSYENRRKRRQIKKFIRNTTRNVIMVSLIIVTIISVTQNVKLKDSIEQMNVDQTVEEVSSIEVDEVKPSIVASLDNEELSDLEENLSSISFTEDGKSADEKDSEEVVNVAEEKVATTNSSKSESIKTEEAISTEPSEEYFGYSEEDYKYLVMVLTGECQSFDVDTQVKFGSVVLNRLYDTKYFGKQNTIKEVVLAKGQYSCFKDGNAYRTPTEASKEAAMWLLENGSVYPDNVIFQAQFKQGDGVYEQVGNTYFCYKN